MSGARRFKRLVLRVAMQSLGMAPALGMLAITAWVIAVRADCWTFACITQTWASGLNSTLAVLGLLHSLYYVVQALQWSGYREHALVARSALPSLTLVIPAYNEGAMVCESIASVLASDYPEDMLHVVAVDDGSSDDTYTHIAAMAALHPTRVQAIRFACNRGKRAALAAGIDAATSDIVACLDSDSKVDISSLRHLVAPFVDSGIGAVSGRVVVLNQDGILGRMLQVQYTLAFDFARAAQSSYRTVCCCPGALSAFRRKIIVPHLPAWLTQRFLGRPVSHGEDQALTNIVLRQGLDTVYQRRAVVHTLAPTRYFQLCKMFARWDRSTIVEGFSFATFMFSAYRQRNRFLPALNFCLGAARLFTGSLGMAGLIVVLWREPAFIPLYLAAFLGAATLAAMYYLWTERSAYFVYGILYALFSLVLLQWIFPYALVTVRDERWGTR